MEEGRIKGARALIREKQIGTRALVEGLASYRRNVLKKTRSGGTDTGHDAEMKGFSDGCYALNERKTS